MHILARRMTIVTLMITIVALGFTALVTTPNQRAAKAHIDAAIML